MSSNSTQITTRTKAAIFGAASLAFCGILVETSMNVTFPTLMRQFNTSLETVQWVTTAYLLAVAATMVITAFIQARFHWQTIINVGGSAFVLGGLLCALAPSLWVLLPGRIIQAIGTGFALPLVFAQIMTQIPFESQGRFTGTAGMLIALAPSLGPTYGGLVTQLASWRLIFGITLPFGLIAWLVTAQAIQQPHAPQRLAFPGSQFILIIVALIGLLFGVNNFSSHGLSLIYVGLPLLLAIVALIGFIMIAARASHPLINLTVFKQGDFTRALLIYFLIQFIQIGMTFLLPNFAQLVLGKNALVSGLMLLAGSLCAAIISPFAGKLMDRRGARLPFFIGSGFIVLATLGLALTARHLSVALIVGGFVIFQIEFACLFNNALTYGLQQLPPHLIGDGNALFNTLQQYAGSLGTAIMAVLMTFGATVLPHAASKLQTTVGTQIALWFSLIVIVLVAGLALTVKRNKRS
ncbi:DHA2 family efflux MFS transporter permease subunit [Lactiplantibacillus pentosus]|uniref:DHA2 family efflux MFS transporter permease subunit n=1 Tax=Lactiplantibacillus pentosus TaxID=1589 RepID=UPI00207956A7|nr:DHA2 family efflux MFS transporter permease subunit [Lactiplantibacillus pentosus]USJ87049.1 DHA2 family efflux MFS transporter permease subunit [Lactiplantibacillus pentosus]